MREHNARNPEGIDRGPRDVGDSWNRSVITDIPSTFVGSFLEGGWLEINRMRFRIKDSRNSTKEEVPKKLAV